MLRYNNNSSIKKCNSKMSKKMRFVATDEDLNQLKHFKLFLEFSLFNVNNILELFEFKE